MAGLTLLQAYGGLPWFFAKDPWDRTRWPYFFEAHVVSGQSVTYREFGSDLQFEYLADEILKLDIQPNARIAFIDAQNTRGPLPLTNPWKYTLRTRENGKLWDFTLYYQLRPGTVEIKPLMEQALRYSEILIVAPPGPMNPQWLQENALAEALFKCSEGGCADLGVQRIARIPMAATDQHPAFEFQVFRNEQSNRPASSVLPCYQSLIFSL